MSAASLLLGPSGVTKRDVIVVGGGAAGMTAARELSGAGLDVVLLEARNRLGGRIFTIHDPTLAVPVELGAEFVHGTAEEVFALLGGTRILADRLPDLHWWSDRGRFRERRDFWKRINTILARAARTKTDVPFGEFLQKSRLTDADRKLAARFVEGYHAADLSRISAHSLADADAEQEGENPQFRIVTGYDSLLEILRTGCTASRTEVRTSSAVTRIAWKRGDVEITVAMASGGEETVRARAAVVTVPLGVLEAGSIDWDPRPRVLDTALAGLAMGDVCKITFRFRERFWADGDFLDGRIARRSGELNFVHSSGPEFPTWWSHAPAIVPLLTAWTGGPPAARLLQMSEEQRADRALDSLAKMFALPRAFVDRLVDGWWTHDWRGDPHSRGAYSYTLTGGSGARRRLARPVDATLWFAGEAVEEEQSGTVPGAIASGRRSAVGVIAALGRRR